MDRRPDRPDPALAPAPSPMPTSTGKVAVWVLVVQCLLALSWTLYVLFLPPMLAEAGIERRWFVYVLIADQAIFAACDWAAGAYADRLAGRAGRIGRAITGIALLSSAGLLAMPWIARAGQPALLLGVIFLWAATSSALRPPVFALIGRVREVPHRDGRTAHPAVIGRTGAIAFALVGISLAGAIGPYLTLLLKAVDPRLPIAVSAIALAAAGIWAVRIEALLPHAPHGPASGRDLQRSRRAWSLAAVVLVAAFGTQTVTAIVAQPLFQRFVGSDALLWVGWFWIGFMVGLVPGSRIAGTGDAAAQSLRRAAVALLIASAGFAVGARSDAMPVLVAGIAAAGAAWGVFTTVVFAIAVSLSGGRATVNGAGTASGMVFSAIAVGTLLRLTWVAAGWSRADVVVWLPAIAWLLAGGLCVVVARTIWHPDGEAPAAFNP